MKVIKFIIISLLVIIAIYGLIVLTLVIIFGGYTEIAIQPFLTKIKINKVQGIEIHEFAKIKSINGIFYFSYNRDKIAYIDNDNRLTIFDIPTQKEDKIYQFRNSEYNQEFFSSRTESRYQPRLLWSPDDSKILFADCPDLFFFDFTSRNLNQAGDFQIADIRSERFSGVTVYSGISYSWLGSNLIIYDNIPTSFAYLNKSEKFLIKDIQSGSSKAILFKEGIYLKSFKWANEINALIKEPETISNSTIVSSFDDSKYEFGRGYQYVIILINENLASEYKVSLRECSYKKGSNDIILEVKNPEHCLSLIGDVIQEPMFSKFINKDKLRDSVESSLKGFLVISIYPDGKIKYKFEGGVRSPNGKMALYLNEDGSEILFRDLTIDKLQEMLLIKPIRAIRSVAWLFNEYILFLGENFITKEDAIYRLNINNSEINKYPDWYEPGVITSPNGEKVMVNYRSGKYHAGDAEEYRYHNLALIGKDGQATFLFKILCLKGLIVDSFWDKNSRRFYFITGKYNSSRFSKDRFDKEKAANYSFWAIEFEK